MKKKSWLYLCGTVLASSLLFGCGSGGSVSEEDTSEEQIEITLWDLRTEETNGALIDQIIENYEAENPNVTISRSAFTVTDLRNTIKPAINSGEGPDIFSYDSGAGYLGVLASSGLAYDMTDYAEENGWYDKFHDWALDEATYDGKLYGITNELELLGVFYNIEMFEELGLTPPETYEDFVEICETFSEAGITAFIAEDKDQWEGYHYESIWLNSFAGSEMVTQALNGELEWNNTTFANALDEFYNLIELGYAYDNPLSVSYDDANSAFYAGEAAMRITGTWVISEYVDKLGDNVGFFYLPSASEDVESSAPGGLGEAVVINNKSENIEATLDFLDYMFSDETMQLWYEGGYIPSVKDVDYSEFELSTLFEQVVDEINTTATLGINIDPLMSAGVNSVTENYMQELIAGKIDGQTALDQKQEAFETDIEDGNYTLD